MKNQEKKILVIGSSGQIGTELVEGLRTRFGNDNVVSSDIKEPQVAQSGPFAMVNAMDRRGIERIIDKYEITEVYLLAALLSATAEKDPAFAWELNMESLFIVLELAREGKLKKVYWPSSIAVFGPTTPKACSHLSAFSRTAAGCVLLRCCGMRFFSVFGRCQRHPHEPHAVLR